MGYVKGVHHIAIRVKDFDRTMDLYTRVLGMQTRYTWGEGDERAAMLDCGDACIELFAGSQADRLPEGAFIHLALRVEDCDGAYQAALAAGCTSRSEPKDVDIQSQPEALPVRIAFVYGYDGEVIEFFKLR
nr:VOC family protein [bacterium]